MIQGTLGLNSINKPIQCKECGGYGHIQVECANTKKNLSFLATWSDDELEDYKGDEEQDNQPITLEVVSLIPEPCTNHQDVPEDVTSNVRTLLVTDQVPLSP